MQEINFGRIERLVVRDCEPEFDAATRVVREVVFGKVNSPHPARDREDFALKEQVIELLALFDRDQSFLVEVLVIQNGLPVRMTVADAARGIT